MTPEQLKLSILRYFLSKPEGSLSLSLWKTYKLKDIAKLINGRAYKKDELLTDPSMTPVLRVGNLFTSKEWYYSDLSLPKEKYVSEGDLIYCWSASFGPSIWTGPKAIFHYHIWKLILSDKIDKKYLFYFLSDKNNIFGETEIHGSTMHHLTKRGMENINILVPPLKEQKLIVTKIEQLMPLVDQYALAYNRLKEIDNSFNDKMKQSILQYAMEGKLVAQDPTDEPASELLKTIRAEKSQLIKEKKIKRSKKLTEITQEEIPFEIPAGWEWTRLQSATLFGNFESVSGDKIIDGEWVVDMKDVNKNGGGFNNISRKTPHVHFKSNKYKVNKESVLYGKLRPYLKKVEIAPFDGYTSTEIFPIQTLNGLLPTYLRYCLLSPYFVNTINQSMYGIKMPRVGTQFLASQIFPLPPLDEQKRIVAKINYLFQKL